MIINRPAYMRVAGEQGASALVVQHFPKLQLRIAFTDGHNLYGMSADESSCHLFDMEGALAKKEYLSSDMILAGILLAVHDVTDLVSRP